MVYGKSPDRSGIPPESTTAIFSKSNHSISHTKSSPTSNFVGPYAADSGLRFVRGRLSRCDFVNGEGGGIRNIGTGMYSGVVGVALGLMRGHSFAIHPSDWSVGLVQCALPNFSFSS